MSILDYCIFALYMCGVLAIGFFHFRRNKSTEDYYVGSRSIKSHHVGLSIVATDVGGGFSIGLGGVGFAMGIAGSWLLFTGLVGAWLTAVLIIPRIKAVDAKHDMFTYPDFLRYRYNGKVALLAAIISGIGYLGFTGAQILAGAKLASATMITKAPFGLEPLEFSLYIIAFVTILYTVVGGLKAVIYTDTVQWIILLSGLILVTIPVTLFKIGGFSKLKSTLPPEYFSLGNIDAVTFINWMVTIIPIWLIGMTLYQRMYACKDEKEARRAWYIAGIFEYPIMAFTGVFLGMCARVVFPEAEAEMALPMLIKQMLPIGVTGIVIAAYFSAIMSTADSCLMASSGNFVNDVFERYLCPNISAKASMRLSMGVTLLIGILSIIMASRFATVLDAILYAYAFMVSGLFIPTLGAYFWKRASSIGALGGMLAGGILTLLLLTKIVVLPQAINDIGLDPSLYGILLSGVAFISLSLLFPEKKTNQKVSSMTHDRCETLGHSEIQHGPYSNRIYLMKLAPQDLPDLTEQLETLAQREKYTKIFAKVPQNAARPFLEEGYQQEAFIPGFYKGKTDALFLGKYLDEKRATPADPNALKEVLALAQSKAEKQPEQRPLPDGLELIPCCQEHADEMSNIYKEVFPSYPFPIHDPGYLRETMQSHIDYFGILKAGKLIALSSSEMDLASANVEMTDFATLPPHRGQGLARILLQRMEEAMHTRGMHTAYTIARALSPGMNITFAQMGYQFSGALINNTQISGSIESMNIWYKPLR